MRKSERKLYEVMEKTLKNIGGAIEARKAGSVDHDETIERIEYELQGYHIAKEEHVQKVEGN